MLHRLKTKYLFTIGVFFPILLGLMVVFIAQLFPDIYNDEEDVTQKILQNPLNLLSALILAPAIETLIQYVPVKISDYYLSRRCKFANFIAIVLSAIVFASLHNQHFIFLIPLFFAGLTWATLCLVFIQQKINPYLSIALMHFGYNLIILSLDIAIYGYA